MDPILALANARKALTAYWQLEDNTDENADDFSIDEYFHILDQLAVSFDALDTWMKNGGFNPWKV